MSSFSELQHGSGSTKPQTGGGRHPQPTYASPSMKRNVSRSLSPCPPSSGKSKRPIRSSMLSSSPDDSALFTIDVSQTSNMSTLDDSAGSFGMSAAATDAHAQQRLSTMRGSGTGRPSLIRGLSLKFGGKSDDEDETGTQKTSTDVTEAASERSNTSSSATRRTLLQRVLPTPTTTNNGNAVKMEESLMMQLSDMQVAHKTEKHQMAVQLVKRESAIQTLEKALQLQNSTVDQLRQELMNLKQDMKKQAKDTGGSGGRSSRRGSSKGGSGGNAPPSYSTEKQKERRLSGSAFLVGDEMRARRRSEDDCLLQRSAATAYPAGHESFGSGWSDVSAGKPRRRESAEEGRGDRRQLMMRQDSMANQREGNQRRSSNARGSTGTQTQPGTNPNRARARRRAGAEPRSRSRSNDGGGEGELDQVYCRGQKQFATRSETRGRSVDPPPTLGGVPLGGRRSAAANANARAATRQNNAVGGRSTPKQQQPYRSRSTSREDQYGRRGSTTAATRPSRRRTELGNPFELSSRPSSPPTIGGKPTGPSRPRLTRSTSAANVSRYF